jgi:hypothetical protein
MGKASLKLKKYINPQIKVGDKVKLIDGSALSHIKLKGDFYIVDSYPEITGEDALLKDIVGEVVKTKVKNSGCFGAFDIYVQDIVVKLGKAKFRTCSKMVRVVEEENFMENLYLGNLPVDFDEFVRRIEKTFGVKSK